MKRTLAILLLIVLAGSALSSLLYPLLVSSSPTPTPTATPTPTSSPISFTVTIDRTEAHSGEIYFVRGQLLNSDRSLVGEEIMLMTNGMTTAFTAITDSEGRFEIKQEVPYLGRTSEETFTHSAYATGLKMESNKVTIKILYQ